MSSKVIGRSPNYYIRKRFLRYKPAVFGLIFISVTFLVALLGYSIMPDNNQPQGFFGAKRNYFIIGTLVVIIGVIIVGVGYNMIQYGEKAKEKYETVPGQIVRFLSEEEEKDYEAAKDAIQTGGTLEVVGIVLAVIGILSLYNYQKGGIIEKAKDILIMRSIGAKKKSLRRMINFEGMYIIIPSILLSLSIGMILNSIVLFDRAYLPPLYIPFAVVSILFVASAAFNYLSLIPIMRKINQFSIKDCDIY